MRLTQFLTRRPKPADIAEEQETDERAYIASQWQLMWWKFRRHRLAMICGVVVICLYLVAAFVEPIAAYDPEAQDVRQAYRPPTAIHFVDAQGNFHLRPFVYGTTQKRDLEHWPRSTQSIPARSIRSISG